MHVGVMLHVCKLQEGFLLSWFYLTVCVFLRLVLRAGAATISSCVPFGEKRRFWEVGRYDWRGAGLPCLVKRGSGGVDVVRSTWRCSWRVCEIRGEVRSPSRGREVISKDAGDVC